MKAPRTPEDEAHDVLHDFASHHFAALMSALVPDKFDYHAWFSPRDYAGEVQAAAVKLESVLDPAAGPDCPVPDPAALPLKRAGAESEMKAKSVYDDGGRRVDRRSRSCILGPRHARRHDVAAMAGRVAKRARSKLGASSREPTDRVDDKAASSSGREEEIALSLADA